MEYLLALKRNHNNYLPIEFNLTPIYQNEELNTLEGIDKFTSKITTVELIVSLMNLNLISKDDPYQGFSIIYKEKDKTRELKEGPIFKESPYNIDDKQIINFIYKNLNKKQMINELISRLEKNNDTKSNNYIYILKNHELFKEKGEKFLISSISVFEELPYNVRRKLKIYIIDKYMLNLT